MKFEKFGSSDDGGMIHDFTQNELFDTHREIGGGESGPSALGVASAGAEAE